jgi:hypothetical protein
MKYAAVRFAVPLAVWMAAAQAFTPPPTAAQVAVAAEEITTFLENHALTLVSYNMVYDTPILHMARSELMEMLDGRDLEAARSAECFNGWDEMIQEDKVECVGVISQTTFPVLEWFPALGTLMIDAGRYEFDPARTWSVDEVGGRLLANTPFGGEPGEITFFDASRLTITVPTEEGDVRMFLAAASSDDGGRADDAARLAGTWVLVQVDDRSLHELPITYDFHGDGSFNISVSDRAGGDAAPQMGGPPPEGLWSLSISRVDASDAVHGEPRSARLLVLASRDNNHEDGPVVFVVEHLDPDSLVLASDGMMGVLKLRFRRQPAPSS